MADKIHFDLVSPERLLVSEDAEMVTVPGSDGYFGAMAGHELLVSTLRPGMIDVKNGADGNEKYFIRGGFAEVNASNITVLAEEAIPMAEFDIAVLDQRIKDMEENLVAAKDNDAERMRIASALDDLRQLRAIF
jgi:F-type H+-transporting ATPase subunit epsilon